MKNTARSYKDIPLEIVGSTKFGRYPKISVEQTFNMIISDDWLVPFAGYKNISTIFPNGSGRGIYSSSKLNRLFAVVDDSIWKFDSQLLKTHIGSINTFVGDVFIAENNAGQVAFSDLQNLYIYDSTSNTLITLTNSDLGFVPGYITFQNGRFVSPDILTNSWRLSAENNGLSWPEDAQHIGSLQTKTDFAVATIRFPGRGNLLYVFGKTVTEPWVDVGNKLFPYQKDTSVNVDYGCLNAATIAQSDSTVCWLGANEKSGAVIMYTNGGDIITISNDGINFKLAQLTNPSDSYAFMFKQDGHLFYVITFPDDNLSYAYDFNTEKFFTLTDENMGYFVAKRVAFFNNKYYFVSINDGNLYELSSKFTNYEYANDRVFEIPRIRIPAPIRYPDQSRFVIGYSGFTVEQGITSLTQRIDLSLSKDGGVNFGNVSSKILNTIGNRINRLMWWQLGSANDLTQQFRFYGFERFAATNGITGIRQ